MRIAFVVALLLLATDPVIAQPGPRQLQGASMIYDTRRKAMLLFGGRDVDRRPSGTTWEYRERRWQRIEASGPAPRVFAGMAHDTLRGETVLFGGIDSTYAVLDDTWVFRDGAWRLLDVDGPSPRTDGVMPYDAQRCVVVLFGGTGEHDPPSFGDTWEFGEHRWRQVQPLESRADSSASPFREASLRRIAERSKHRPADAQLLLRLNAELHPQSAEAHYQLADHYAGAGEAERALVEANRALQLLDARPMNLGRKQYLQRVLNEIIRRAERRP